LKIGLGFVSTIAVTVIITRIARQAIEQEMHTDQANQPTAR